MKIVFACRQFKQTKTALIHVDHILPASRKSALYTIDDRNHKCIYEAASDNGMDGWKEMGIQYCPWAILVFHLH